MADITSKFYSFGPCRKGFCECIEYLCRPWGGMSAESQSMCSDPTRVIEEERLIRESLGNLRKTFPGMIPDDFMAADALLKMFGYPTARAWRIRNNPNKFCGRFPPGANPELVFTEAPQPAPVRKPRPVKRIIEEPSLIDGVLVTTGLAALTATIVKLAPKISSRLGPIGAAATAFGGIFFFSATASASEISPNRVNSEGTMTTVSDYRNGLSLTDALAEESVPRLLYGVSKTLSFIGDILVPPAY